MPRGKVYIASMNLRGIHAEAPNDTIKLNVTSAQAKTSPARLDFSPMTPISGGYKGYWNFEHYWQSGKVFEGLNHNTTKAWWKAQTTPHRRYPNSRGMKVKYAIFDDYPGEKLDYVTSRKKVYVPEYFELMKNTKSAVKWRKIVERGDDVCVFDFDGPRNDQGEPVCELVTLELLKDKINDTKFPFGHGFIISGYLAGFQPKDYLGDDPKKVETLRDMGKYLLDQISDPDKTEDICELLQTNHIAQLNLIISYLTKVLYFGVKFDIKVLQEKLEES
jgi:hypothetical protein